MLILSRRPDEAISINGGEVRVTILGVKGNQVRIGIEAPEDMTVNREEVEERIKLEGKRHAG